MNQSLFKKELITTKIFQEEKNNAIVSCYHLKNKYIKYDGLVDFASLYAKIINYQIKTYGSQLANPGDVIYYYFRYLDSRGKHWRKKI